MKIIAFSYHYEKFRELDTEILEVSVDSEFSHLAWLQTARKAGGLGEFKYPLISNIKKEISINYHLLTESGVTLRVLYTLQHIKSNPEEVCPAEWQPGEKTIIPTPIKSKDYFAAT